MARTPLISMANVLLSEVMEYTQPHCQLCKAQNIFQNFSLKIYLIVYRYCKNLLKCKQNHSINVHLHHIVQVEPC